MTIEAITSAALALPPESRAALAEALLRSIESAASDITFASEWEAEIEDRLDAWRRGEMKLIPRDEVMRTVGREQAP